MIFGRSGAVCPDAKRVKAARKAAAKNLEFILHLELAGGSTLNRFGAECKPVQGIEPPRLVPVPRCCAQSVSNPSRPVLLRPGREGSTFCSSPSCRASDYGVNADPDKGWRASDRYNAHMRPNFSRLRLIASVLMAGLGLSLFAQDSLPATSAADRAEAREVFKQLIEINTTDTPAGNVTNAAVAMQKRFLDAGFSPQDVRLLGPDPRKQNLVVRIRAAGQATEKPVLFLCHIDVLQALRSDWHTDPFEFVEKDGYYYGRGTQDMKDSDAALVF